MLSIIIPTLNEEKNLPLLLESIKKQNFPSCEIIVADANSSDKTSKVAKDLGCKVVAGGLPPKAKNIGAKAAEGSIFLFIDADIVLPEKFLERGLKEFNSRHLNIAGFRLLPRQNSFFYRVLYNFFYNWPIIILERLLPHAAAVILVKKELFERLKGFDEEIKIAEDHDLARRAKKIAGYGVLRSTGAIFSDRRFRQDGWFRTFFKYVCCEAYIIFFGPIKSGIFRYKFGHYKR